MNKFTTLFVALLLFTFTVFSQVNLTQGLIAYYPLNNSGLDSTANNLDLTAFGSPTGTINRFGNTNGAYFFNATNPDYMTAALNPLLAPTAVSLSAWVKLPNAIPDQKIAGRAVVGAGYLLGVDSNKIDAEIWDLSAIHYRLKAESVPNNSWTQIVMTYEANTYLKVYINGQVRDSIPAGTTGIGTSATWTFTVGAAPWQTSALNVSGSIDDIYVYNRAINEAEVQALFSIVSAVFEGLPTQSLHSVYPIPVKDKILHIDFKDNTTGNVQVRITDVTGKNVFNRNLLNPGKEQLHLNELKSGIYNVTMTNGERQETHKIIIE